MISRNFLILRLVIGYPAVTTDSCFPTGTQKRPFGPKPFPHEGTLRSRRTSSLARNPPHPTCASPTRAPSERGQDPNISQSFSHVVDVPSSSRIDQALFIRSGLHDGRHDTRANRQNQFRTRLGQGLNSPYRTQNQPLKQAPRLHATQEPVGFPRSRFGISMATRGQMANLPYSATDLAGGTRGSNAKPPEGGAY